VSGTGLERAAVTDSGVVRDHNEDSWGEFLDPSSGFELFVVCDGMGGHVGGETASREAVAKIGEVFLSGDGAPEEVLRAAFQAANAHVHALAGQNPELSGMGTTGVGLLIGGTQTAWVVHVGDSRAYLLRDGRIHKLTEDHSLVAQMVRDGVLAPDEAKDHPMRNEIVRSIGIEPELEAEVSRIGVEPGDRFLLCSDGLTEVVPDEDISALLDRYAAAEAATHLLELANSRGAPDNVTVQVVHVPARRGPKARHDLPTSPLLAAPARVSAESGEELAAEELHPAVLPLAASLVFALVFGVAWWWTLDDDTGVTNPTFPLFGEDFSAHRDGAAAEGVPAGVGADPSELGPEAPSGVGIAGEVVESGDARLANEGASRTGERRPDQPVWIPVADAP
jgi:serine/threonine protein phosphatase PrpC